MCVFETRKVNRNITFYIYNELVEVVDNFTYPGVNFYYNGNLSSAVKIVDDQVLRVNKSLLVLFDKLSLDIKLDHY